MTTFNKGDEVLYKHDSPGYEQYTSIGIFDHYDKSYSSREVSRVMWMEGGLLASMKGYGEIGYPVYTKYLSLTQKPYDPKQMGDRDDDI